MTDNKGNGAAEKLKQAWEKLTPEHKKKVVWMSMVALVIIFALGAYYVKTKSSEGIVRKTPDAGKKEVALDKNLLEKNAYLEGKKELTKVREELEQMKKDIKTGSSQAKDDKTGNLKTGEQKGGTAQQGPQVYTQNMPVGPAGQQMQVPPGVPQLPALPAVQQTATGQKAQNAAVQEREREREREREESLGGIESASNSFKEQYDSKKEKKSKSTVFLPPSFMQATLLSGLDAPASAAAKSHPMPALLRIKDMAFLPNDVKRDLKGCFVIAEGTGNLADERAHLRLVTLSCLSKKGRSVINSPIKGFVVDESGKIGIRGTVVSKMGAVIARSLIAGFVAGFGDAMKQSTTITSLSALGSTQTLDTDKLAKAGFGQGVSQAAQEIQKFYLDLARQTVPVIEIGATRELTLVVSDGVELEIKEIGNSKFSVK